MKRLLLPLFLVLVLALAACGGTAETPQEAETDTEAASPDIAGHYIVYGFYYQGDYVYNDVVAGSIDLDPDGTGYLDWGEDNQGPITSWTAEGEELSFQAGVATITGTVRDGVMVLDMDDFSLWLAREGVDVEALNPVSSEDYMPAAGEETEETRALAGTYYIYGAEQEGDWRYQPGFPDEEDSRIELAADGTGLLGSGDEGTRFKWSLDGSSILWEVAINGMDLPYPLSVKSEGILAMEDEESNVTYYYAQADADVSGLNARPTE